MLRQSDICKAIVDAAVSTFSWVDFHEATMRDIAERAGVGLGTIYHYFHSKEQLLYWVLEAKSREFTAALNEHLAGVSGTFERLTEATRFILRTYEQDPELAWLSYVALPLKGWVEQPGFNAVRDHARILRKIIEDGQAAGDVRFDIDARLMTRFYFGGLGRVIMHWIVGGRSYSLEDESDGLTLLILRGISARSGWNAQHT